MAANWTLKEHSTGELTVTIEGEAWKAACDKAFKKLANSVTIPGFRKGKAPVKVLEQKISKAERQMQAIDDNMNAWLVPAVEETGAEPISRPEVNIKAVDDEHVELTYTYQVMPEVKLGEYKGVEYAMKEVEVSEEEIEAELKRMVETYADIQTKEGAAELGDTVNIDYEGFKDEVAFDGGKAEKFDLELGSGSFIPGFEDQLVGAVAGEEKELNLTFPEDYHAEELKGAAVVFKVKVNEVKTKVLPEVNDDFAKDVSIPGVETAEDLKNTVKTRLLESKTNYAEQAADSAFLEKLSANAEVEIPEVLVQEEEQNMFNNQAAQLQQYGISVTQYLQMMGQTAEDMLKSFEEEAKKSVKIRLVLSEIAKAEKIEPTDEEVEEEFKNIATAYNMDVETVKGALSADIVKLDLRNNQAFKLCKDAANRVAAVEEPAAE